MSAIITAPRPTQHYQPHNAPKGFFGFLSWLLWKGPVSNYLLKAAIWLGLCTFLGLAIGKAISPEIKKVKIEKAVPLPKPVAPTITKTQQCQTSIKQQLAQQKIRFRSGSSQLQKESNPLLKELVKILQTCPEATIQIAGYTDNQGSEKINERISLARAASVSNAFKKQGISKERLSTIGYGEAHPIANNATAKGRAQNRRIEIIVK